MEDLITICQTQNNCRHQHLLAQYSLQLAIYHLDSYNHRHNTPTQALPPLLHCLSICDQHVGEL